MSGSPSRCPHAAPPPSPLPAAPSRGSARASRRHGDLRPRRQWGRGAAPLPALCWARPGGLRSRAVGVWCGPERRTWTATSWPSSSLPVSARPGLRAGDVLRGSPRCRDGTGSVRSASCSRNGFRSPHAVRWEPQTRKLRGAVAASRDTLGAARGCGAELSWSWDALWEQSRCLVTAREALGTRGAFGVSGSGSGRVRLPRAALFLQTPRAKGLRALPAAHCMSSPLAAVSTSLFFVAVLVLLLLLYRRDPTCCQFLCSCRFFQSPGQCVSAPCPRAGLCWGGTAAAPLGGPGRAFLLPSLSPFGTLASRAPRCSALRGRGLARSGAGKRRVRPARLCAVPGEGAVPSDAGTALRALGAERRLPRCPGRWVPR